MNIYSHVQNYNFEFWGHNAAKRTLLRRPSIFRAGACRESFGFAKRQHHNTTTSFHLLIIFSINNNTCCLGKGERVLDQKFSAFSCISERL